MRDDRLKISKFEEKVVKNHVSRHSFSSFSYGTWVERVQNLVCGVWRICVWDTFVP